MASHEQLLDRQPRNAALVVIGGKNSAAEKTLVNTDAEYSFTLTSFWWQFVFFNVYDSLNRSIKKLSKEPRTFVSQCFGLNGEFGP